jgi:hypothetical protein
MLLHRGPEICPTGFAGRRLTSQRRLLVTPWGHLGGTQAPKTSLVSLVFLALSR